MKKKYEKLCVTPLGIALFEPVLAASRPIEYVPDVTVNDFSNGNEKWAATPGGSADDFNVTFE